MDHPGCSRRASCEAIVRGVAPLGKDQPLPARRAWRLTASQLSQPVNITETEYCDDAWAGQPVAGFFIQYSAHFSTIDPISDNARANTLQQIGKKARPANTLSPLSLILLTVLGACERAKESDIEPQEPEVATASSCGSKGHLSTQLYGSIERRISWSSEELACESMLRPEGEGVRLRFTGNAADSQLAIILALPSLERGSIQQESPTVVTLIVEGSGRFFSTHNLGSCWSDIASQDLIDGDGDRYDISGTLYCVAPLGEINGDAAISIPELEFRAIVDWSAT